MWTIQYTNLYAFILYDALFDILVRRHNQVELAYTRGCAKDFRWNFAFAK